jgi:hypothetical protein
MLSLASESAPAAGEDVPLQRSLAPDGFTFTKFDGTTITV